MFESELVHLPMAGPSCCGPRGSAAMGAAERVQLCGTLDSCLPLDKQLDWSVSSISALTPLVRLDCASAVARRLVPGHYDTGAAP